MLRHPRKGLLGIGLIGLLLGLAGCKEEPACGNGALDPEERCDPKSTSFPCPAKDSKCDACPVGTVDCGGSCVDPNTDRTYCGAKADCGGANAGVTCPDGYMCNGAGVCELSCQDDLLDCGGICIEPNTNRTHCGAKGDCTGSNAGVACADGYVCNGAGVCELSCQAGLVDCGGTCIDPNTDRIRCGASADCAGANDGTVCPDGYVCNGAGVCELSCQAGLVNCGGTC
ncbi:MAG: hypothetical protein V2A73_02750, partial [Pseudomonadota bacterium]